LFFFLTLKYYFSDENKKNSYRSYKALNEKIVNYSQNIILLKNNTKESVEYIEETISKNKKNFYFWKLKTDNEK